MATFEALYTAEHDRLVRLAVLILGSSMAAEDVVQEAFAKLHRRLDGLDNPAAWLRVAVVNGCRNEHRRLAIGRRHAHRVVPGRTTGVESPELIASLRRLPLRQRTVIVLRYYEDLPEAEIAKLMKVQVGTVKSTLHRALSKLRQEVEG
jgi:RNA polymerase sigma-70 factor (sigma-E family)